MTSTTAPLPATEPTPVTVPTPVPGSERLVSLDVYRGLTIAGMILVTDPGTYSAVYGPLLHAAWNGWTLTDMIFPSFLFISGVAMTFSFASRIARGETRRRLALHLAWRALLLIVIGLILNGFPLFDLHHLRIPGILQRIALCYLAGGLLYLVCTPKSARLPDNTISSGRNALVPVILSIIVVILAGYWALLKFFPVPGFGPGRLDSLGNLGAYIDRAVFGTNHLWAYGLTPGYGVTYDPEGLLSTLPALTNLLVGILVGAWLRTKSSPARKALAILAIGIVLFFAGRLLDPLMPINKRIYTPTFALLSIGFGMIAFSAFYWIIDIRRWRWWTPPALVFGTNAIFAFAISTVITSLFDLIRAGGDRLSLHTWAYTHLFLPWLSPVHASLAYAITIVLLNLAIVLPLYRRRIFLRI
jgi:predicted acyltransferase